MRPSLLALPPALVLVLALASAGCDKPIPSICKQLCQCTPCTDNDFDTCVTLGQNAETKAQKKGVTCGAKFDTFISCFNDNLSCQSGAGAGTDKCSKEEAAVTACAGFDNPFTTQCQEATAKLTMCNAPIQSPVGTCVGVNLCIAQCQLAQPCDVLDNMTFSQTFQDCENACANNSTSTSVVAGGGPVPN